MRQRRRVLHLVVAVLAVGLSACSTPPPVATNAVPPPAVPDDQPVVWASLGGDETLTADPADVAGSWTQRVLARLPGSAQLVDVATEDATVQVGLTTQLAALTASPAKPTVATVWFGTAEPNTPRGQFTAALTQLVTGLQSTGVARIVLISRSDGTGDRSYRYAAEIEAVAKATGVSYANVSVLTGNPGEPGVQAQIADQLTPIIAP